MSDDPNIKLKGVMEFYIQTYFDLHEEDLRKAIRETPGFVDPEVLEMQAKQFFQEIKGEAVEKFHTVATCILNELVCGNMQGVREFEVLFLDLFKRTIIRESSDRKSRPTPIVIIADPNVNPESN